MKAQVKVNATTIIEIEAASQKDLFKAIASAHEVFGEKACGLCKGTDILPVVRTVQHGKVAYEFCEYHCRNRSCGARLAFGTIHDVTGTLFPQRKLMSNGKTPGKGQRDQAHYGDHNGWSKFKGTIVEDVESQASAA